MPDEEVPPQPEHVHRHLCSCFECRAVLDPCEAVLVEDCLCEHPNMDYGLCARCEGEVWNEPDEEEEEEDEEDHDRHGAGGEWESYTLREMQNALDDGEQWRTREGPRRRKEG